MSEKILTTLKVRHNFARSNRGKLLKQACFLMCKASNGLANQSLWEIKQYYKEYGKFIGFTELDRLIRDSEKLDNANEPYNKNYKSLIANSAQWTIKTIFNNYKSFFALLKKKQAGKYEANVETPNFRKSGGLYKVIYAKNQYGYNKKTHAVKLGISKKIKEQLGLNGKDFIEHKLPDYIKIDDIQEVRIQPSFDGLYYDIEIVYKVEKLEKQQGDNFLSIDLGIDNFASCITNNGDAFIYSGKELKSYNQFYSKQISNIQAVKDKCGLTKIYTKKQKILTYNRKNYINNYFNQIIASIIKYCKNNNIQNIIVGNNEGWKSGINIGKINNQKFYAIPFNTFLNKLEHKANICGINFILTEESYTSKCSFLDSEEVNKHNEYKGKRIKRGLFKTSSGKIINADINGAANILKKALDKLNVTTESKGNILAGVSRGFMNNPIRLKLENNFTL